LMQVYFSVEGFWLGLFQNGYYFDAYDKILNHALPLLVWTFEQCVFIVDFLLF
jgi:hypothetical protein